MVATLLPEFLLGPGLQDISKLPRVYEKARVNWSGQRVSVDPLTRPNHALKSVPAYKKEPAHLFSSSPADFSAEIAGSGRRKVGEAAGAPDAPTSGGLTPGGGRSRRSEVVFSNDCPV